MKKTIEIDIPEGFCDVKVEGTGLIFLKDDDLKPKSWEEAYSRYAKSHVVTHVEHIMGADNFALKMLKPIIALVKLSIIREMWVGEWNTAYASHKWSIMFVNSYCTGTRELEVVDSYYQTILSFPTKEMAEEFMDTFTDLIWETEHLYD